MRLKILALVFVQGPANFYDISTYSPLIYVFQHFTQVLSNCIDNDQIHVIFCELEFLDQCTTAPVYLEQILFVLAPRIYHKIMRNCSLKLSISQPDLQKISFEAKTYLILLYSHVKRKFQTH